MKIQLREKLHCACAWVAAATSHHLQHSGNTILEEKANDSIVPEGFILTNILIFFRVKAT